MGTALPAVALVLAACLAGGGGGGGGAPTRPTAPTTDTPNGSGTSGGGGGNPAADVTWSFDGGAWTSTGTPPDCPAPLAFTTPTDLSRVTSILYPGQNRGGDYKAHGGFRFDGDGETGAVTVVAPMDAEITRASQYLNGGERQYLFEFVNDCGVMYRFDHLRDLSPTLQQVAAMLPPAVEDDSRTTNIPPGFTVTTGQTVATSIGFPGAGNFFFDWGVYDLRDYNTPGQSAAWRAAHPGEFAAWGVCWFDNLPAGDAATVRSLPPSGASGAMSDYCF